MKKAFVNNLVPDDHFLSDLTDIFYNDSHCYANGVWLDISHENISMFVTDYMDNANDTISGRMLEITSRCILQGDDLEYFDIYLALDNKGRLCFWKKTYVPYESGREDFIEYF